MCRDNEKMGLCRSSGPQSLLWYGMAHGTREVHTPFMPSLYDFFSYSTVQAGLQVTDSPPTKQLSCLSLSGDDRYKSSLSVVCFCFFFLFTQERISLCSSNWSGTLCVEQAALNLPEIPLSLYPCTLHA